MIRANSDQRSVPKGIRTHIVQKRTRNTGRNTIDIASLKLNAATAKEAEGMPEHCLIGFLDAIGSEGTNRVLSELTRDDFARWPVWALANPPLGRRKKRPKPAKLSAHEATEPLRRRKKRVNRVLNNFLACLNFAHENGRVATDAACSKLKRLTGTVSVGRWPP